MVDAIQSEECSQDIELLHDLSQVDVSSIDWSKESLSDLDMCVDLRRFSGTSMEIEFCKNNKDNNQTESANSLIPDITDKKKEKS